MPFSHPEKNQTINDWVNEILPANMLDIGPGSGFYGELCRPSTYKVAIEIWGPYVKEYKLDQIYDNIIISDARFVDYDLLGNYDVAFAGDVLEHMTSSDAAVVFDDMANVAKNVIICLPIIPYPQGEWNGNPYEAHVATWSHDEVISFFGEPHKFFKGDVVGAYWYKGYS